MPAVPKAAQTLVLRRRNVKLLRKQKQSSTLRRKRTLNLIVTGQNRRTVTAPTDLQVSPATKGMTRTETKRKTRAARRKKQRKRKPRERNGLELENGS